MRQLDFRKEKTIFLPFWACAFGVKSSPREKRERRAKLCRELKRSGPAPAAKIRPGSAVAGRKEAAEEETKGAEISASVFEGTPYGPRSTHLGEVAEWSIVPDSKSGVPARVPRVRIPPSPPSFAPRTRCYGWQAILTSARGRGIAKKN